MRDFMTLISVIASGLVTASLFAQTSPQEGAEPAVRYSILGSGASSADASTDAETRTEYAASLDGSGLISMDSTRASRILLGSAVSVGWDTNPDNLASSASSGVSAVSPYLGFQSNTPRTQLLVQYQPTIITYSASNYGTQTMQIGSFRVVSSLNQRWSMDGRANASFGQDSARFVGPQQTVVVGGVPGTGPAAAAYVQNAGTGTNINAAFTLNYAKSDRETLSFSAADTLSRYSGLGESNSVATNSFSYNRGLSPRLAFLAYGQTAYYYGSLNCAGFGGGAGVRWQIQKDTVFAISAGPQFDTSACKSQQGASFNASLGTRLTATSQLYFQTSRLPTVSYLGGGLWQTGVSAGYQRQIGARSTASFDVSHLNSDTVINTASTSKSAAASSYGGSYFDAVFGRRLGRGLNAALSYRNYTGSLGGSSLTRNIVAFSISWAPDSGHIQQ